jgi:pantoate--beta-alanine ligase
MHCIDRVRALRERLAGWRSQGQKIALVTTMGNLHAGHLSLVTRAKQIADRTVVTVFVNPTQFVQGEDYAAYPRTFEEDREKLESAGTDLLFHPAVEEIYPDGFLRQTKVMVEGLDDILCGKFRPGHFTGVATVVTKLLNIIQPDAALFGEKDYQQLLVIRRLVSDLNLPVDIIGVATVREADGLAMSSRNVYLNAAERKIAPLLFQSLTGIADAIRSGETDYAELEGDAVMKLQESGFRPEYLGIRKAGNLNMPDDGSDLVVLAAAWLGKARLIDNVLVRR